MGRGPFATSTTKAGMKGAIKGLEYVGRNAGRVEQDSDPVGGKAEKAEAAPSC